MRLKSHHMQQHSSAGLWQSPHCLKQCSFKSKHFTGECLMEQKRPKSHRFQSCLLFCMKNRVRMEQRQPESTKSKLKDLALKWFTETQAPLILHEGNFPAWFQGFISRQDAEDQLRDKDLGCFLIRLSDKATGYILSYKGRDRCRHFVINQNKEGHFMVTGDTEMHDTLTSLIEYYKTSPIEPFGEYLTVSCFKPSTSDLYDVVHYEPKGTPGVSVEAVKRIWDQRAEQSSQFQRPPAMPPKMTRNTPVQGVPPVPKRGSPLKTNSLEEQGSVQSKILYAQLEKLRPKDRLKFPLQSSVQNTEAAPYSGPKKLRDDDRPAPSTGTVYSELSLSNYRSKSLPVLDDTTREERSYRLSTPSPSPLQLSPNLQNVKSKDLRGQVAPSHSLDKLGHESFYELAGQPANPRDTKKPHSSDATYAEVPFEPVQNRFHMENTYEQIPEPRNANAPHGNTYETLEDVKSRPGDSGWGIKSDKWKWLLPEHWKK